MFGKKGSKILNLPSVRNCFTLAMTNKLVVIINSLKVTKINKILLYEMKFLVPNYSCPQNPWLWGYRPQIPVLSVLCPQLNLLNPPPRTKFLGTPLPVPFRWKRYAPSKLAPVPVYNSTLHDTVPDHDLNNKKEFLCITHTVKHNYISPSSTVGIQLRVSALYVDHRQVVI